MSRIISEIFSSMAKELLPITTSLEPTLEKSNSKPIKAVVFDIYGTLFISASGDISIGEDINGDNSHLEGLIASLKKLNSNFSIETTQDLMEGIYDQITDTHNQMHHKGIEYPEVDIVAIWRSLLKKHSIILDHHKIEEIAAQYEMSINPVYPMPNLNQVLSQLMELVDSRALQLGIVSNAQFYTPALFTAFTNRSLLEWQFHPDLMIFSYQVGRGKPDLLLYELLRERLQHLSRNGHDLLNISPDETLYVGNDMLKDIWAAKQCGFQTALFAGDKRSLRMRETDARCINLKPDYILTNLEQILSIVRN